MIRLFVMADLTAGDVVTLSEKQHHYALHVMRLHAGEPVLVFNGRDGLWQGIFQQLDKKAARVFLQEQIQPQTPLEGADLYMAIIKKEAMDLVIQKAVELGVRSIHPVLCARSVVSKINQERLQQIAIEAAEQCERLNVPAVLPPVSLADALAHIPHNQVVAFLNERGENQGLLKRQEPVAFFVGPEGGFTPAEIQLMRAHPNAVSVHLGQTILRAETAAIAALSCYAFDIF